MSRTIPNLEFDCYRILVFRRAGIDILLLSDGCTFSLPEVAVPRWQRIAPHLAIAVREKFDLDIVCLDFHQMAQSDEDAQSRRYALAEIVEEPLGQASLCWVPWTRVERQSLRDQSDLEALHASLAVIQAQPDQPFGTFGWLSRIREWVNSVIVPHGLRLSGRFEQLNAGPRTSLLRFETDASALWFKAVAESQKTEFRISQELARIFPKFVPEILGINEDWNAWLMKEFAGVHPDVRSELAVWKSVTKALAELQIASLGQTLHLIDAGCRDMRTSALCAAMDPFVRVSGQLMRRQTSTAVPALSREELAALRHQLAVLLRRLEDLEIPNTLGHLDFNPGNILVSPSHCHFLDWAEAAVGNPFLTFEYLLAYLRRVSRDAAATESELRDAYAASWKEFLSPRVIREAFALARVLAVYAVVIRLLTEPPSPESHAFVRSLIRRMKREIELFVCGGSGILQDLSEGRP